MSRSAFVVASAVAASLALAGVGIALDRGLTWPAEKDWPHPGDALFIAKSDLTVGVERADLRFAPAAQTRCTGETCTYTFTPCQEVWVRQSIARKGILYVDVPHLRSAKVLTGRWWLMLVKTEEQCRADLAAVDAEIVAVPWGGPGPVARDGWKVEMRPPASAKR